MKPKGQRMVSGGWEHVSVDIRGALSRSGASSRAREFSAGAPEATARQAGPGRLAGGLLLALFFSAALAAIVIRSPPESGLLPELAAGLLILGVATGGGGQKWIQAGVRHDWDKNINVFTLSLDAEVITLDPGETWAHVDRYKWSARGLMQEPQSFRINPDGTVQINAETIGTAESDAAAKLEREINRRHVAVSDLPPAPAAAHPVPASAHAMLPDKVRFKVKLDHWGHLLIESFRGAERVEASLRGITSLIANGLMLQPRSLHVDPLQRYLEIDGVRFDCSATGAQKLEEALNASYAPRSGGDKAIAIEIRENLAATTGFDIHFAILRAGQPVEIKGHLSQETLDILQDHAKCNLLQPGIHLRLSPPYLLIRRRRPDGGEDSIPDLPDVHYRHINSVQLQHAFNHPAIRAGGGGGPQVSPVVAEHPADLVELRVVRRPDDKTLLWLECVTTGSQTPGGKAFTHHNMADFQHAGVFRPHLDVCLSLDHRRLSILNRETHHEETLTLSPDSSEADLVKAGRMLTNAIKPVVRVHARPAEQGSPAHQKPAGVARGSETNAQGLEKPGAVVEPAAASPSGEVVRIAKIASEPAPVAVETPSEAAASPPKSDPAIVALFGKTDPVRLNLEIFRRLGLHFGIAAQDVRLSLPCVFENRRFEIIPLEPKEISSIMQLRAEDFYGFYLSHIKEQKVVLVYACNGAHLEWGPDKCVLQPSVKAEADTFKGSALLGMAQDPNAQFVFVVQPAFKEWSKPREKPFAEQNIHFVSVSDLAAAPDRFTLIWPERPGPRL